MTQAPITLPLDGIARHLDQGHGTARIVPAGEVVEGAGTINGSVARFLFVDATDPRAPRGPGYVPLMPADYAKILRRTDPDKADAYLKARGLSKAGRRFTDKIKTKKLVKAAAVAERTARLAAAKAAHETLAPARDAVLVERYLAGAVRDGIAGDQALASSRSREGRHEEARV